jgi:hypothetical protein
MCSWCSFRCSAKSAQRSESYWRGQWSQRSRNGYWWSARFWSPISSRSIKFNCQCRTTRQISRKHARLDWYVSRPFQPGIFSTPTSIGRLSTTRLFNLCHTGKHFNISMQCYTPCIHIVYDIILDIIPDIYVSDMIPDIWPDVKHHDDIWKWTDWFHPWIRKLPVLSQAVEKFLKHFIRNTHLMQE